MAPLALNLTFYLSLTLMLGAAFTSRAPIVGIPIAITLVSLVVTRFAPGAVQIIPVTLVFQPDGSQMSLVTEAMQGRPSGRGDGRLVHVIHRDCNLAFSE